MQTKSTPHIGFQDGTFRLEGAGSPVRVPLTVKAGPLNQTAGRMRLVHKDLTIVYDKNGLSLTRGKSVAKSKLAFVATSGKLMSLDERKKAKAEIASGERIDTPAGLSGFQVVGDDLFLLMRWETKERKPWLEAILKLNLTQKFPKADIIGSLSGFTTATGRVNDRLAQYDGSLRAMVQGANGMGLSTFNLVDGKVTFQALGPPVLDCRLLENTQTAIAITKTPSVSYLIGIADLETSTYREVSEVRGQIINVFAPGILEYKTRTEIVLLNLLTGSEARLGIGWVVRATSAGLLAFTPAKNPTQAIWLGLDDLRQLAKWQGKSVTPSLQ